VWRLALCTELARIVGRLVTSGEPLDLRLLSFLFGETNLTASSLIERLGYALLGALSTRASTRTVGKVGTKLMFHFCENLSRVRHC
jgi:hypothetical protein